MPKFLRFVLAPALLVVLGCPAAAPCKGKIKKVVRDGQTRYEKLSCTGKCGATDCEWKSSRDHHGATREWCGCTDTEPTNECMIVLYTPGPGTGGGAPEVLCPPRDCAANQTCSPVETQVGEGDGSKVFEITCACK